MADIQLDFPHDINVSVQLGDLVYWVETNPVGIDGIPIPNTTLPSGFPWESTTTPHDTALREEVILIGPVVQLIPWNGVIASIIADYDDAIAAIYGPPNEGDFIMFSKDNKVNLSSLLGYYSLLKLRNNSKEKSEMFSVAANFIESSK